MYFRLSSPRSELTHSCSYTWFQLGFSCDRFPELFICVWCAVDDLQFVNPINHLINPVISLFVLISSVTCTVFPSFFVAFLYDPAYLHHYLQICARFLCVILLCLGHVVLFLILIFYMQLWLHLMRWLSTPSLLIMHPETHLVFLALETCMQILKRPTLSGIACVMLIVLRRRVASCEVTALAWKWWDGVLCDVPWMECTRLCLLCLPISGF